MKLNLTTLFMILLLAATCTKRKYPEEKVQLEKEDIFFTGYIDNEAVDLRIGADGYYCYSSHKQTHDSIYIFEGELRKFNCNPCTRSLKLQLSDFMKRAPGTSVEADSCFRTGARHFIPALPVTPIVELQAVTNKAVASVRWDLGDGRSFSKQYITTQMLLPGPQTISLTVTTTGNCQSSVANKVYVEDNGRLFYCGVTTYPSPNNSAQFSAGVAGGRAPYTYSWNFGDGATSNAITAGHTYQYSGSYPVRLRVTDADNKVCESEFIHVTGSDSSSCSARIALYHTGYSNSKYNGVLLQWTDASGSVLRSDLSAQPAGSYFEIIDSHDFPPNERGESGRLLTFRFNVLLSDGTRKTWFKSENAAIAVAYK